MKKKKLLKRIEKLEDDIAELKVYIAKKEMDIPYSNPPYPNTGTYPSISPYPYYVHC